MTADAQILWGDLLSSAGLLGNAYVRGTLAVLMRNRFDQLAKQIGQKALGSFGTAVAQDAINPETQYADLRYEPDPARQADRERLGLLGRIAASACIIEAYSDAPGAEEFRACLTKHLTVWQQRVRDARSESKKRGEPQAQEPVVSFLWIIAAGAPTTLLDKLRLKRAADWSAGVYLFGDDILRVGIVVASQLPRDRTTLLVRLMAAGPLLAPAVREVAALPPDAYERAVAEPILLQFQHMLGQSPTQDPDEQEFIMAMLKSWEEGKAEARAEGRVEGHVEGRAEGRVEGHAEGRVEGRAEAQAEAQANAVLTVLRVRGIEVPEAARKRILAETDLDQLARWLEKAIVASSIGHVIAEPK